MRVFFSFLVYHGIVRLVYSRPTLAGLFGCRADHHTFFNPFAHIMGAHAVEEEYAGGVASALHARAGRDHIRRVGSIVGIGVAQAHAHVTRSPLCERDPRHGSAGFGILQRTPVLDLQAEQKLAVRIQRPDIGFLDIFLW